MTAFHKLPAAPVAKISGARALRSDLRSACADVDRALSVVEGVLSDIEALGEPPEQPETTNLVDDETPADVITSWLDRQRLLSLISAEGAAAVERLIEDLR